MLLPRIDLFLGLISVTLADIMPQNCGRPMVDPTAELQRWPRLLGGSPVVPDSWPWLVALANLTGNTWRDTIADGLYGGRCGGIVISPKWLLTSKRCVEEMMGNTPIIVMAGNPDANAIFTMRQGVFRRIVDAFTPTSRITRLNSVNLALCELDWPLEFGPRIQPICMPKRGLQPSTADDERFYYTAGWGDTSLEPGHTDVAMKARVKLRDSCQGLLYDADPSMVCGSSEDGLKDSCPGDDGNPLIEREPDGTWALQGIVHWFSCGVMDYSGVYVKIFEISAWIRDVVEGRLNFADSRSLRVASWR